MAIMQGESRTSSRPATPRKESGSPDSDSIRDAIRTTFFANIKRVEHLAGFYLFLTEGAPGHRSTHAMDILRAATVLLHAALEEVLRSLIIWKFPYLDEATLNEVPLQGISDHARPERFFLGKLAAHRGETVLEVLQRSVEAYALTFSASSTRDVCMVLKRLRLDVSLIPADLAVLDEFISRRHHIVHQADRNPECGSGRHSTRNLNEQTFHRWLDAAMMVGLYGIDHVED